MRPERKTVANKSHDPYPIKSPLDSASVLVIAKAMGTEGAKNPLAMMAKRSVNLSGPKYFPNKSIRKLFFMVQRKIIPAIIILKKSKSKEGRCIFNAA